MEVTEVETTSPTSTTTDLVAVMVMEDKEEASHSLELEAVVMEVRVRVSRQLSRLDHYLSRFRKANRKVVGVDMASTITSYDQ